MAITAKRFVGYFSLRTGCIVAAISQLVISFMVMECLEFLRPQLDIIPRLIFLAGIVIALLGLFGVWRRSVAITWIFALLLTGCSIFLTLLALDLLGLIQIFPTHPVHLRHHKPVKTPSFISNIPDIGNALQNGLLPMSLETRSRHRAASLRDPAVMLQAEHFMRQTAVDEPGGNWAGRAGEAIATPNSTTTEQVQAKGRDLITKFKRKESLGGAQEIAQAKGVPKDAPEDVTEDVTEDLPEDLQKLAAAHIRHTKKVIAWICGTLFMGTAIWLYYVSWIALSFGLNRCIPFDILQDQPDQFEPLLTADYSSGLVDPKQLDLEDDGLLMDDNK